MKKERAYKPDYVNIVPVNVHANEFKGKLGKHPPKIEPPIEILEKITRLIDSKKTHYEL
jgi:hypothetical protein